MNTPTVNLFLFTSLCLSSSSQFSMTQSFWLSFLSQYWTLSVFSSALSIILSSFFFFHSLLSAPDCESALLWQFCCRALQTCMSFCIAMSLPMAPYHPNVLRVRAVLPQQRGNAKRMLHQCCGQDYLKNLLKLILHFIISAHSAPHMDGCIVLMDLNEAISVWSISSSVELSSFFCREITFSTYRFNLTTDTVEFLCIQMLTGDSW